MSNYFPHPEHMSLSAMFFMLLIYGYTLLRGAMFIGEGSEMLLLLFGPGLIGGILLPIINVIPDIIIIIVSGAGSGEKEEIEHEVLVGLGTLLGSSIFLLTLRYAVCNLFGLRDLKDGCQTGHNEDNHKKAKLTSCSLTESGNAVLNEVPLTTKIMLASTISLFIVQTPALIFKLIHGKRDYVSHEKPFILTAMIIAFLLFITYCIVQFMNAGQNQLTRLKQEKLRRENWKKNLNTNLREEQYQEFIFRKHDRDNSGYIEPHELKDALKDMGLHASRGTMKKLLEEIDVGNEKDGDVGKSDGKISLNEFKAAINIWMKKGDQIKVDDNETDKGTDSVQKNDIENQNAKKEENNSTVILKENDDSKKSLLESFNEETEKRERREQELQRKVSTLEEYKHSIHQDEDDDEEEHHINKSDNQLIFWAVVHILHGLLLLCVFSEPAVGVVTAISNKLKINGFYVSLILSPMVLNSREVLEGIPLAKRKTSNSISMLLYQSNGTVTMNNTLVLGVFLAVIYCRDLPWNYSAEIYILISVVFITGLNTLRNQIKLWQTLLVLLFYPISVTSLILFKKFAHLDH